MATDAQVARLKRDVPVTALSSMLTDDEIKALIDEHGGNHFLSVAHVYDLLAVKASEKGGSIAVGKYREDFSSQSKEYSRMADYWRGKTAFAGYAGGISKADMKNKKADSDRNGTTIEKGIDSTSLTKNEAISSE